MERWQDGQRPRSVQGGAPRHASPRDRAIDGAGAEALRPQGGRSTFGGGTEGFTIQLRHSGWLEFGTLSSIASFKYSFRSSG